MTSKLRLAILLLALVCLGSISSVRSAEEAAEEHDHEGLPPDMEPEEEEEEEMEEMPEEEIEEPEPFEPLDIKVERPKKALFTEMFADETWKERWTFSKAPKFQDGKWEVKSGNHMINAEDSALFVGLAAKHHAVFAPFSEPLNLDKDVVIQYQVRFNQAHQCGGAYLKLTCEDADLKAAEFDNETPYTIMFGPDKCGMNDKVHFIFRHKSPVTGEYEEKHLKAPPMIKNDLLPHVYTLIVKTDNTFEILIDLESVKEGSLLEEFEPAVNPPKEIDDPEDKKPEDWVDDVTIPDPEATKPDDWDEDAPREIEDEEAEKPEGWLDDAPEQIADPSAVKPEDWDDEEDGDWEAPLIDNPECEAVGCGPWKPPMVPNPEYKGKWQAPMIDNPEYKGEWKPKQIPNPDYFEDLEPHLLTPIGGLGIELWTMQDQIEFDNFYVGHDLTEARTFAEDTWRAMFDRCKEAQRRADAAKAKAEPSKPLMEQAVDLYKQYPSIVIVTGMMLVLVLLFAISHACAKKPEDEEEKEEKEAEETDKKAEEEAEKKEEADKKPEEEEEVEADKEMKTVDKEKDKKVRKRPRREQ